MLQGDWGMVEEKRRLQTSTEWQREKQHPGDHSPYSNGHVLADADSIHTSNRWTEPTGKTYNTVAAVQTLLDWVINGSGSSAIGNGMAFY